MSEWLPFVALYLFLVFSRHDDGVGFFVRQLSTGAKLIVLSVTAKNQ
jgi:hypothetical protein